MISCLIIRPRRMILQKISGHFCQFWNPWARMMAPNFRRNFRRNFVKLWPAVYPSRMAPFGLKLWENAFQTIPNISFFDSRKIFRPDFSKIFWRFFRFFILFWRAAHFWTFLASSPWKTTSCRPIINSVRLQKWYFLNFAVALPYDQSPLRIQMGRRHVVIAIAAKCYWRDSSSHPQIQTLKHQNRFFLFFSIKASKSLSESFFRTVFSTFGGSPSV